MIADSAIYVDGRRDGPYPLQKIHEACREKGGFAWIGLYEPTEEEFASVAGEFGLHELAVKDAITPHQRPRIERYGDSIFVVLKAARYLEKQETVEFGEIQAFVGPDFVITLRYGEAPELRETRQRIEGDPDLIRKGPFAGLENDIDEIEVEVFGGKTGVSRRIYELSREVIQFHQAAQPLAGALRSLTEDDAHDIDPEVRAYLRDIRDRALRVTERVEGFRELLSNILTVNFTIVGIQQTDQTKKISAWAAIVIVPTLIAGIYGMNFDYMPELQWRFGYPFALSLMVLAALLLYLRFKRSGWL